VKRSSKGESIWYIISKELLSLLLVKIASNSLTNPIILLTATLRDFLLCVAQIEGLQREKTKSPALALAEMTYAWTMQSCTVFVDDEFEN
jgi:hypothetical protein